MRDSRRQNKSGRHRQHSDPRPQGRRSGPRRQQQQHHPPQQQGGQHRPQKQVVDGPEMEVSGVLDILPTGVAFLRRLDQDLVQTSDDPFLPSNVIRDNKLQSGMLLKAMSRSNSQRGGPAVTKVLEINGLPAEAYQPPVPFDRQISIDPEERYLLTPAQTPTMERSLRLLELMTPIGKGQRALIVAPPKTGKTTLLHDLASSVAQHHPETHLFVLLIDERPEEVTHFGRRRNVRGNVIASSSDKEAASHLRAARLTLEMARNLAENGKDVFLLLDSITRLSRASNREQGNGGKTMSGGVGSELSDCRDDFWFRSQSRTWRQFDHRCHRFDRHGKQNG